MTSGVLSARPSEPTGFAPSRESGFTLIELMVALALAAIISFCISYVSIQADQVYRATTDKVEVYQKFRYALSDIRRSLENMIPTADLEFFVDRRTQDLRGHWEEGEEYDDPENLDGGRKGYYDEAAQVVQRGYRVVLPDGTEEEHDDFSIYLKTTAEVDGQLQVANVEYYLADPRRLAQGEEARIEEQIEVEPGQAFGGYVLVKVIRYVDVPDLFTPTNREVKMRVLELCQNVTDFRVEYFYDNRFGDSLPGRFVTPEEERSNVVEPEVSPRPLLPRFGRGTLKEFIYGGFRPPFVVGTAFPAVRDLQRGQYQPVYFTIGSAETGISFSELGQGDTIFLWSEAGNTRWPAGEYTLARNENGRLFFEEKISSSFWTGAQTQIRFRAGYVPSAFRITVRILNDKGGEPRIISQVVRTLHRNPRS